MGDLAGDSSITEGEKEVRYFRWPQDNALQILLPILHGHLPYSNPLYNRMKAPHNIPSRHCLLAATIPPDTVEVPPVYTILFADRSRKEESQIWTFNSLSTIGEPLSDFQQDIVTRHGKALLLFLKDLSIPEAPGWPFSPILKFACLHEHLTSTLQQIGQPIHAVTRQTEWNCWLVNTSTIESLSACEKTLPEGYTITRVPDDQLDIVISTSSIPRQPSTYKLLPSIGVLNTEGKLIAWGYIGIDGSFATLYVLPDFRGKGLSSIIGRELLSCLNKGKFSDIGFDGMSGWAHADVYDGNSGSEAVMKSLRGVIMWKSSYVWIDSAKF